MVNISRPIICKSYWQTTMSMLWCIFRLTSDRHLGIDTDESVSLQLCAASWFADKFPNIACISGINGFGGSEDPIFAVIWVLKAEYLKNNTVHQRWQYFFTQPYHKVIFTLIFAPKWFFILRMRRTPVYSVLEKNL